MLDTIKIPSWTIFHTILSNPEYQIGNFHYAAWLDQDVKTYRENFPSEIFEREGDVPVYDYEVVNDYPIRVASEAVSRQIFKSLYMTGNGFAYKLQTMLIIFSDAIEERTRHQELNDRENKVRSLLSDILDQRFSSLRLIYDAFVTSIEIDQPLYPEVYELYFQELKRAGYNAFYDVADIYYNTYKVEKPIIIVSTELLTGLLYRNDL